MTSVTVDVTNAGWPTAAAQASRSIAGMIEPSPSRGTCAHHKEKSVPQKPVTGNIVLVEGNPLENIANAHHVKRVIANGRVFDLSDLVK